MYQSIANFFFLKEMLKETQNKETSHALWIRKKKWKRVDCQRYYQRFGSIDRGKKKKKKKKKHFGENAGESDDKQKIWENEPTDWRQDRERNVRFR